MKSVAVKFLSINSVLFCILVIAVPLNEPDRYNQQKQKIMGLFSNNKKGKGSHPFFHKATKTVSGTAFSAKETSQTRTVQSMLFVKQYDILTILREVLMPQNQN
ncbi:MAG: hypothetical protein BGP15_22745 [Sphingobacterium sp. 40-24]|nr:MAG: hypothetical protein BGP15_22745 [Sphingobacterium sp. 40-24]HAK28790.1 hypothetical protein [Sphingobacterium sp.]